MDWEQPASRLPSHHRLEAVHRDFRSEKIDTRRGKWISDLTELGLLLQHTDVLHRCISTSLAKGIKMMQTKGDKNHGFTDDE